MHERIRLRRVYDTPRDNEGTRVLVDRLWPRGLSKAHLGYDHWFRELAPSTELRKWFNHDPERWATFRQRYRQELRGKEQQKRLAELVMMTESGPLTLLYAARDREHNQAVVLRDILLEQCQPPRRS